MHSLPFNKPFANSFTSLVQMLYCQIENTEILTDAEFIFICIELLHKAN